jgi:hypothetical protein
MKKDPIQTILNYLADHTYAETGQNFHVTIAEIKKKIAVFNKNEPDPVFRQCDHQFVVEEILHKHGIEHGSYCNICQLHTTEGRREIGARYPNALITKIISKDCDKSTCVFCEK